jgi:hypothetical protein
MLNRSIGRLWNIIVVAYTETQKDQTTTEFENTFLFYYHLLGIQESESYCPTVVSDNEKAEIE